MFKFYILFSTRTDILLETYFKVWAKFDNFLLHRKLTKIWSHSTKKRKGLLKWILVIVQIQINLGIVLGFIKVTINYNSIYDRLIVHIHLGIVLAIHPMIVKIDVNSSLYLFLICLAAKWYLAVTDLKKFSVLLNSGTTLILQKNENITLFQLDSKTWMIWFLTSHNFLH